MAYIGSQRTWPYATRSEGQQPCQQHWEAEAPGPKDLRLRWVLRPAPGETLHDSLALSRLALLET